jgi:hypothetical protein
VTPLRKAPVAAAPPTPAREAKREAPKGDDSIVLEEVEEPPAPPPPPPPKPETVDKCGCKVTDFACAIRCSKTGK